MDKHWYPYIAGSGFGVFFEILALIALPFIWVTIKIWEVLWLYAGFFLAVVFKHIGTWVYQLGIKMLWARGHQLPPAFTEKLSP